MKVIIDIDENLYTRLFDNGKYDAVDMLNICAAARKGVPVKCGKWLEYSKADFTSGYKCSKCGHVDDWRPNFCSECGATMKK